MKGRGGLGRRALGQGGAGWREARRRPGRGGAFRRAMGRCARYPGRARWARGSGSAVGPGDFFRRDRHPHVPSICDNFARVIELAEGEGPGSKSLYPLVGQLGSKKHRLQPRIQSEVIGRDDDWSSGRSRAPTLLWRQGGPSSVLDPAALAALGNSCLSLPVITVTEDNTDISNSTLITVASFSTPNGAAHATWLPQGGNGRMGL